MTGIQSSFQGQVPSESIKGSSLVYTRSLYRCEPASGLPDQQEYRYPLESRLTTCLGPGPSW